MTETSSPSEYASTPSTPSTETVTAPEFVQAKEVVSNHNKDHSPYFKWIGVGIVSLLSPAGIIALTSLSSKKNAPKVIQPSIFDHLVKQHAEEKQPSEETKPAEEIQPIVEVEAAEDNQPSEETKPAEETQPIVEVVEATEENPPSEATKPAEETQPIVEAEKTQSITTKIYYPNGDVVSHSAETALDLNRIQYKTFSTHTTSATDEKVIFIDQSHPAFAGLVAGAEAYAAGLSTQDVQAAIEAAYQKDTDEDGVIDALDREPMVWNVSERDLRSFSVLAYENGNDLARAFSGKGNPSVLKRYQDGQIKVGKVAAQNMDLEVLTKHWNLLEFGDLSNGLQYAVFGNDPRSVEAWGVNKLIPTTGSPPYHNIVVAFRGTEATSINDLYNDMKIYDGRVPPQAEYLQTLAQKLEKYHAENIYATGHSLGGYLAQYFAAHTMQSNEKWQESFTHSALFNPVPLPNTASTATARQLSNQFTATKVEGENFNKTESYVIKGEFVSEGALLAGVGVAAAETAKGSLWGVLGGLIFAPFTGGASLALGAKIGAGIGAVKGIKNGAKAIDGLGTYHNTNLFDFKEGEVWGKHDLASFFERDGQLKRHFTHGYRMDSYYLHDDADQDGLTDYQEARIGTGMSLKDTDNDGIIDVIEVKVAANALSAEETPWAVVESEAHFDDKPLLMTAEVEQNGETTVKGIVLTPERHADGVLYTVSEVMDGMPSVLPFDDITDQVNLAYLFATDGDDVIEVGKGHLVINSGEGNDVVVFKQINPNGIVYFDDLDINHDQWQFDHTVFTDRNQLHLNTDKGSIYYQNMPIATFGQELDISNTIHSI